MRCYWYGVLFLCSLNVEIHGQFINDTLKWRCAASSGEEARRGSHCFEVPFWHQRPVRLDAHLARLRGRWPRPVEAAAGRLGREGALPEERDVKPEGVPVGLNVEVSRYTEAVLTPFLDTYFASIRGILGQLSTKMRTISEEEIKEAERLKDGMHRELKELADQLELPAMCDEERRRARTLASGHVARVHGCVVGARAATDEMAGYIEEIIRVARGEMRRSVVHASGGEADDMRSLSQASVSLGFELDLSLTNARRHSEQSCLRLAQCAAQARREADRDAAQLKEEMHQCVYA